MLYFYIMSNVCCKELKGWCKSFTRTEALLSLLQLFFLVLLILSLTFIILHFIACTNNKVVNNNQIIEKSTTSITKVEEEQLPEQSTEIYVISKITPLPKDIDCTWTPSHKTEAFTHYYDFNSTTKNQMVSNNTLKTEIYTAQKVSVLFGDHSDLTYDGVIANKINKDFLLALVKITPSLDVTFGCTLTIVAQKWTLTAASCIEAIEEVDSLDSFVMMRGLGERNDGDIYTMSDILIHPEFQGVNKSYDLAAIKSDDDIVKNPSSIVYLATMMDYLLTTVGQRFSILGFGKFRNFDKNPRSREIREVSVYRLPLEQCTKEEGSWSPRHLWGGRDVERGGCGGAAVCAGVARARGPPCHYCAGAPLLRARTLLALMAAAPHCGLTCAPALYVNLAPLRDWLDAIISD